MHEERVDLVIIAEERLVVGALAGPAGALHQLAQRGEVGGRRPAGGDVRDPALDRLPGIEHVQDVVDAEGGDQRAAARVHDDETVRGQPGDRLADRHPAELELGRQVLLVEHRPGRQPEVQDPLPQLLVGDIAAARLARKHRHVPVPSPARPPWSAWLSCLARLSCLAWPVRPYTRRALPRRMSSPARRASAALTSPSDTSSPSTAASTRRPSWAPAQCSSGTRAPSELYMSLVAGAAPTAARATEVISATERNGIANDRSR